MVCIADIIEPPELMLRRQLPGYGVTIFFLFHHIWGVRWQPRCDPLFSRITPSKYTPPLRLLNFWCHNDVWFSPTSRVNKLWHIVRQGTLTQSMIEKVLASVIGIRPLQFGLSALATILTNLYVSPKRCILRGNAMHSGVPSEKLHYT